MPCFNPVHGYRGRTINPDTGKRPVVFNRADGYTDLPISVPCGRCIGCLQRRRDQWSIRIFEESKLSVYSSFLTLTYNDNYVPLKILEYNEQTKKYIHDFESYVYLPLVKKDLQKYFKRVRAECPELRYFACGEYGSLNRRPHYHGIVFNVPNDVLSAKWSTPDGLPLGFVTTDEVTMESIHYVTKYMTDQKERDTYYPDVTVRPFQIMSKGLGKNYVDATKDYHLSGSFTEYTSPGGIKHSLPRYYSDRIFTEEQRKINGQKAIQEAMIKMEKMSEKDPMIHVKLKKSKEYKASQTSKSKRV